MRVLPTVFLLLLLFSSAAFAEERHSLSEMEKKAVALMKDTFKASEEAEISMGRAGAMEVLENGLAEADVLLNAAYRETMRNLKNRDPHLAELLLKDQRAWLRFVESFCERAQSGFGEGGTMYINMGLAAKLRFFVQRIGYLHVINGNTIG